MNMSTNNLPPYINYPGNVVMHPPLMMEKANAYGFFIKGDLDKLQATVDTCLNVPASGKMQFEVLSHNVMLTFTYVDKAYSKNPADQEKGYISELDIVTWIMVASMKNGEVDEIYWFPHFIWVDSCIALIAGRELYGYPKYLCNYEMPKSPKDPADYFSCSVDGFQTFSPDTKIANHPLIEIRKKTSGNKSKADSLFDVIREGGALLSHIPDFFNSKIKGIEKILPSINFHPTINQIFLKQFPAAEGGKAAYQAIVEAPAKFSINIFKHPPSVFFNKFEFTLHQVDSFPLAQTLGIEVGTQEVEFAFHLYSDFEQMAGTELVNISAVNPE
jgi:hypothetical protein